MNIGPADALVFFGATGDLAYKKIFPSLQAMLKRGHLDTPVIGVAKAGWNLDQFKDRAKASLEKHGGIDHAAFEKLSGLLRYVDGDYNAPATFQAIRKELGSARRPAHYLAIPPALFGKVVEQLGGAVRGQFCGYRKEPGVAVDSKVETFAAMKIEINSWRWRGVPFYIRAGKCLPVTCTEITLRLRQPPTMFRDFDLKSNYCRFRISPDIVLAFGLNAISPHDESVCLSRELLASRYPAAEEMDAYERVLGDAMAGDATLFAREDYVAEAWRIVDPLLKAVTPVYEYEPKTWGPGEVGQRLTPIGGWQNPVQSP